MAITWAEMQHSRLSQIPGICTSDLTAGMRAYVTNLHPPNGPARWKKKYTSNKSILSISVYCTCQGEERLNGKLEACERVDLN